MKLLLFASVICFAGALAAPADKQKRDILPGDPRYGTDHHHHHEHENEVQITKAVGGYVGSFSVPDTEVHTGHSFQVPNPLDQKPGKSYGNDFLPSSDSIKNSIQELPSTSYGVPDTIQTALHTHNLDVNYQSPSIAETISPYSLSEFKNEDLQTSYGTPVKSSPIPYTLVVKTPGSDTVATKPPVVIEPILPSQPVVGKQIDTFAVHDAKTPAILPETQAISTTKLTTAKQQILPSLYSSYPLSYAHNYHTVSHSSIPVKTVDHHVHVQVPHLYPVPVTKHVTYPVSVPHKVEVPKPYYVRVPQPVQVTVNRPYPVDVPRPVPYPVPHYIRTTVPVYQHVVEDNLKGNPFQEFFDNTASSFQDIITNLPSFNPLGDFQNPFENFQFPSFVPSFLPSQPTQAPTIGPVSDHVDVPAPSNDAVSVENPIVKSATVIDSKATVVPPTPVVVNSLQTVKTPTQKEYVQPTDAKGGYVY